MSALDYSGEQMRMKSLVLPEIPDETMMQLMASTRSYTLRITNNRRPDAEAIIWEHGRRNIGAPCGRTSGRGMPDSRRKPKSPVWASLMLNQPRLSGSWRAIQRSRREY